ncbi:MAG TPA: ABC transporter permease, partial [Chitinophagaceae bacterium]
MFRNYLKTALRNLWRNKTYSFLNIFGLAVGIACAGFIFLWIENELSFDHNNEKRNYIYQVMENQAYDGKIYTFQATPGVLAGGMKDEMPGVRNTARITWGQYNLFSLGDKAIYEHGYFADSSLFSIFTIPLLQGNKETVFRQLRSIAISQKMAQKFFGSSKNIVGRILRTDNKDEYTVSAVFSDLP